MAEQATKEPTMEEILASIRRIISEDGSPVGEASGADLENDDFLDLSSDVPDDIVASNDEGDTSDVDEGHLLSVEELLESEAGFEEIDALSSLDDQQAAPSDVAPLEEVFADDDLDAAMAEIEADVTTVAGNEDFVAETPAVEEFEQFAPQAEVAPAQEAPAMSAPEDIKPAAVAPTPAQAMAGLTGGNTIEGMVAELMKPMIKEWIDSNLPGIVERKVEAEIQLVANKVVAALRD